MKRCAMKIVVFLALGAIVNVAVAWGLAVWPPASTFPLSVFESAEMAPKWRMEREKRVGSDRLLWYPVRKHWADAPGAIRLNLEFPPPSATVPPPWSRVNWREPPNVDDPFVPLIEDARGWPMLSLASFTSIELDIEPGSVTISSNGFVLDASLAADPYDERDTARILPFRPLIPGLIANTLFYAMLLWLLFARPGAARRAIRRRRGLCEKCAYPIGVSPVCTECGVPVARKGEA